MADESVVDQIVKSLSFEVEAVPQGKYAQAASSSNMTPLNVKIRVRKKDKSNIEQGVLSVPKFGYPNSAPERIRLISSDQTIMSFNVLMEADLAKKAKKKTRKYFFGGCLGTQYDDEDDPYVPSTTYSAKITDTSSASKSDGVLKQNFTLLKYQIENTDDFDLPFNKKNGILGKCKPGGCLDPPFGEDNYKYSPVIKDDHSGARIIEKKLKEKDQTQKYNDKKQHNDIVPLKSSQSSSPEKKDKDRVHDNSILSIFEADQLKDSVDTKYSDSIITYPPEASSSTNLNEKYLRNKISSEERQKKSISEGSEIFFSPTRKNNRQKESKEHKTLQESSSDADTEKQEDALVFVRHIENVHEVPEDNLERFKKTTSPQDFTEATFISQETDTKNAKIPENIDKDANELSKKTGTKSGFEDSNDIDQNLIKKLPYDENNNNDGLNDVNSDTKSYSSIDEKKHFSKNPSNMIVNDLDHKNPKFDKSPNIKELKAISSDELKDCISHAIINEKNMKDDYKVADNTDLSMNKTINMEIYDESSMEKKYPFELNTVIEKTNNSYGNVIETMRLDSRTALSSSNELDEKKSIVESFRRDAESRTHEAESAKSTVISIDRIHNKRLKISRKSEEMEPTVMSILDNEITETPDGVISKKQQLLNNKIYDDEPISYIRSDYLANNELEEKKLHIDLQNNKQNPFEARSTFQSNEKDREFINNKESKEYAFPMNEQKDTIDVVDKESKNFSSKQALESNVIGYPKLVPTFKVGEYKVLEDDNLIITPDHALFPTENQYLNNNIEKADTTSQKYLNISNNSKESIQAKATYFPNKPRDVSESTGSKRDYMFGSPSDALCKLEKTEENVSLKDFNLANSASTIGTKTTKATYPSTTQPKDNSESTGSQTNYMFGSPSDALLKLERTGENVSTRDFDSANSFSTLRTKVTIETYPSTKPSRDDSESTESKRNNVFGSPSDAVLKSERTGENVSTKDFDSANSVFTLRTKVTKETYVLTNQNRYNSESTGSNRNDMFGSPSDALLNLERTGENVSTKDFDSANSVSILRTKVTKETYPLTNQSRDDLESTGLKRNDMFSNPSDALYKLDRTGINVSIKDYDSANSVLTLRTKLTIETYPSTKQSREDSESTGSKRNDMLGSPSDAFLKLERTGENVSTKDFNSANSVSTLRTKVTKGTYPLTKESKDDSESTGSKKNDMFSSPSDALFKLERTGVNVSTKDYDSVNSVSTLRTKITKGTYPLTKESRDDSESTGSKRNDMFHSPSDDLLNLERRGENVSTKDFDSVDSVSTLRTNVPTYPITKQSTEDSESTGLKSNDMLGSPSDAFLKLERTEENVSTKDFDSANSVSTLRTKETKGTYPSTKHSRDDLESTGSKRNDMFGSPSDALLKLERPEKNVSTKDFHSVDSVSTLRTKVPTYPITKQSRDDSESTGSKRNDILDSPSDAFLMLERNGENVSTKDFDSANSVSALRTKVTKGTYSSTKQSIDDLESTGSKRNDIFGSPSDPPLVLEKTEGRISPNDLDSANLSSTIKIKATKATPLTKQPRDDSESTGSKRDNMFGSPSDGHLMLGKTEESISRNDFHSKNSASILGTTFQSQNEYHSRTTLHNITTTGLTSSRNSIIKENIILELGFQSYLNDKQERVLKSIDMSKELVHQSNEIVTIIQLQIRPHLNDIIRVPIDSENEISIQIKRTKSPVRFQIQENGQFDHKPSMSKFNHGNGQAITPNIENKSYHEKSHSKITGVKLQRILSSMYEQDLIPLQKSIKYLKQDIELLSLQRNLCKDKAIGPKRSKQIRIFKVNQRCGCWKD